jgi:hypothetical protein
MEAIKSRRAEANDRRRIDIKSRQENFNCEKESFQERKGIMRTSLVGKIMMALIFASVIGGLSAGPALGANGHKGQGPKQQGRHDNRGWYDNRGRRVYRSYRYQPQTIYAPPPVIYAPLPSPGISIFFPPIHIR